MRTGRGTLFIETPEGEVKEIGTVDFMDIESRVTKAWCVDEEDQFPDSGSCYPYEREALAALLRDGQVTQDYETKQVLPNVVLVVGCRASRKTQALIRGARMGRFPEIPECRSAEQVLADYRLAYSQLTGSAKKSTQAMEEIRQLMETLVPQDIRPTAIPSKDLTRGQKAWRRKQRGW